jgi:hypothetical protein
VCISYMFIYAQLVNNIKSSIACYWTILLLLLLENYSNFIKNMVISLNFHIY